MTLPSTCLPTEPTAAPSDLLAVCGAAAQSPGAAPAGTPFASLLTQAASTPSPSTGVPNNPVMYPGIYYMVPTGSPTVPTTVTCAAPVLPVMPVPPSGSEVLTAAACPPPEIAGEKPRAAAKTEAVSDDEASQVSMELVYQFVAGQWMPPPVLQVPLQAQAAGESPIQNNLPGMEQSGAQSRPTLVTPQNRTAEQPIPPAPKQAPLQEQSPAKNTTARVSTPLSPATVPATPVAPSPVLTELSGSPQKVVLIGPEPVALPSLAAPNPIAAPTPVVAPPSSTPPPPAIADAAAPFALENPGAEQATFLAIEGAGMYSPNRRFTLSRPMQNQAPEKFAAPITPGLPEITSGGNPSMSTEEKKSLSIDSKSVTTTQKNVGTSTANREIAMPYSAVNKSPSVDFSTTLGDGLQPNSPTETKVDAPLAAHAPRLVQEIRAIADRISVIDRNSVEVRFDFNDTDRLSVRVEYRDGTVHTTFKTDSSQLRDVVAHEWQSQNSSSEQRSYRMADPVFSPTAEDRQNSSAANDGSGRQRAFEQQAQHGAPRFAPSGRSAGSTTPVAASAARSARPETSQHLHALA